MMADWRRLGVAAAALVLAGCMEEGPLGPGAAEERELSEARAALQCSVDLRAGSMACVPQEAGLPAGISGTVLGGQGTYVFLESSNVSYDPGSETFSADVSVRNLLTQALGTADGVSVDTAGVKVFFHEPATPSGGGVGVITLENADGMATFTRADQQFFKYAQALSPGRTSLPRTWRWHVPADVETFTFGIYVAGSVPAEKGIVAGLHIEPSTISTSEYYTCGLTLDGKAYCWGSNGYGALGNGSTDQKLTPAAVSDLAGGPVRFASISTGSDHTCALSLQGEAFCWGYNGRLGDGTTDRSYTPVAVVGPAGGPALQFSAISAGNDHTCALTTDGKAYCWGIGNYGSLGTGQEENTSTPVAVVGPTGGPALQFSAISAGYQHTCALTPEGEAYCWGRGDNGRLGNGLMPETQSTPVAVVGPAGGPALRFASISAGSYHTCALTTAGKAYCWGNGGFGRLGNGSDQHASTPVEVSAPVGGSDLRFASISAGNDHTCAVTTAGQAYCWGNSGYGKLGNGSGSGQDVSIPVEVTAPAGGPVEFTLISAGYDHTCAVTTRGKAYCWGDGYYGRVGDGSEDERYTPVEVSNPEGGPSLMFASLGTAGTRSCESGSADGIDCGASDTLGRIQPILYAAGETSPRRLPLPAYLHAIRTPLPAGGAQPIIAVAATPAAHG